MVEMHTVLRVLENLLIQALCTSAFDDALAGEDDAMLEATNEAKSVLIAAEGELSETVIAAELNR